MAGHEGHRMGREERALSLARVASYLVLLGIIPLLLAMLDAFAIAGSVAAGMIDDASHQSASGIAVHLVQTIDLVLIGVVLFVVAAGLAQLFGPPLLRERHRWLPSWLVVDSLEALKQPVLSTLVIIIAVSFVDELASGGGGVEALGVGIGAASMIMAIGLYKRLSRP